MRLIHEFRPTADPVASQDLAEFRERIESVRDETYFALTQPSGRLWPASDDVSHVHLSIAVLFLGLGGWFARHLWLRRPAAPTPAPDDSPSGLSGWMVVVAIKVVLTPIISVVAIHATMPFLHQSIFADAGSRPRRSV